ncbi:hypothetical protein N9D23_03665 [Rubripirellula sp.]|nr:hypothetical protein [Rubripirellula sp.]
MGFAVGGSSVDALWLAFSVGAPLLPISNDREARYLITGYLITGYLITG